MTAKKYELMVVQEERLTMAELGRRSGLGREMVQRYFAHGLIDPQVDRPVPLFAEKTVVRIRKIERLRADLGVNLAGCGLVLDLLEKIDRLEDQLRQLREHS